MRKNYKKTLSIIYDAIWFAALTTVLAIYLGKNEPTNKLLMGNIIGGILFGFFMQTTPDKKNAK